MREITIATVQMKPALGESEDNLVKMSDFVSKIASQQKVDLIVFPELATSGYELGVRFTEVAQRIPGPTINLMSQRAAEFGVYIAFGMVTKEKVESVLYNSAVLVGPDGEMLGSYNKVHLRGEERMAFREGVRLPVIATEIGAVGLLLGWDLAFPEVARSLTLDGAEVLCVLANWETAQVEEWRTYVRARARRRVDGSLRRQRLRCRHYDGLEPGVRRHRARDFVEDVRPDKAVVVDRPDDVELAEDGVALGFGATAFLEHDGKARGVAHRALLTLVYRKILASWSFALASTLHRLAASLEARGATREATALRTAAERAMRGLLQQHVGMLDGAATYPVPPGVLAHLEPNAAAREGFRREGDGPFFLPLTSTQQWIAGRQLI